MNPQHIYWYDQAQSVLDRMFWLRNAQPQGDLRFSAMTMLAQYHSYCCDRAMEARWQ